MNRPRGPGIVYTAVLAVVVAVLALQLVTAPQDSPPAIAEIAPTAVEQIKTPPPEQATRFGQGEGVGEGGGTGGGGGEGVGGAAGSTTTGVPEKEVPSVRRCVGNPPRQIEDPQSPPCVPFFQGDNGGATWRGVTKDEITVVVPYGSYAMVQPFESFFNRRFEFYGRRMRFVDYSAEPIGCDPSSQQQVAIKAATVAKAFASSWMSGCWAIHYADELVRQGVVYSSITATYTDAQLRQRAPFLWQYPMALDRQLVSMARWVCNRLARGQARFTLDPTLLNRPRRFGIILTHPQFSHTIVKPDQLARDIQACGGTVAYVDESEASFDQSNHVLQLKQNEVTTVICLCEPYDMTALTNSAQGSAYAPEYVVGTYRDLDNNINIQVGVNKAQATSMMGVSFRPRQSKVEDEPPYWAIAESDPSYGSGADRPTGLHEKDRNEIYRSLLILASGIQMAGPNLTPKTFEQGLHRTVFPNPDTPINAGRVGFPGGTYAMTLDATEFWWSNTDDGPYADKGTGTMCYVDNGRRRTEGGWPQGDGQLFERPCHNGA